MTPHRFNTVRTPAELAAFKARNLAQRPEFVVIKTAVKPAPAKSECQQLSDLLSETHSMIAAAKRQGHFQALPLLLQRAANLQSMLATA